MSLQVVLMIGKDPGWASALMDKLASESLVECLHLDTLSEASQLIDAVLPDLILLFADSLESDGEDVNVFCRQLREHAFSEAAESKPVVVVQTGTNKEEKRIQYLLDGADDTLSSELSPEELRVRVLVQLRRNIDTLSNNVTLLPGLELASKVLQRKINLQRMYPNDMPWAMLLVELDSLEVYNEVYGYLAGNQVLRTFGVMLANMIMAPDLIGHSSETDTFIIISVPERAEKLATALSAQFKDVAPNFYSDKDRKRGYIVAVDDNRVSRRVPLMTVSMGIINSETAQHESYKAAIASGMEMKALARRTPGNTWVSDKFKLTGSTTKAPKETQHILVIESDAALAFLLKTTLEMQQYEVDAVSSPDEALEILGQRKVSLVLMDAVLNDEQVGWGLCETIKAKYPEITVIFISTVHDRDLALRSGADLYLPKPFELVSLFTSVDRVLKPHLSH